MFKNIIKVKIIFQFLDLFINLPSTYISLTVRLKFKAMTASHLPWVFGRTKHSCPGTGSCEVFLDHPDIFQTIQSWLARESIYIHGLFRKLPLSWVVRIIAVLTVVQLMPAVFVASTCECDSNRRKWIQKREQETQQLMSIFGSPSTLPGKLY